MEVIKTNKAPDAVGPYSQGIKAGGFIFTAMQIALDPKTGEIKGETPSEQIVQCMENIKGIIEEGGGGLENIVKTIIYLTDINEFSKINEAYSKYFESAPPARGVVEVSALPKGALVAVEAVAFIE